MGQAANQAREIINFWNRERKRILGDVGILTESDEDRLERNYQAATLKIQRELVSAIENLTAVVAEHLLEPEPLTAEQSIPQADAILEHLRRKHELSAERKARVSTENPPQADPKKSDG